MIRAGWICFPQPPFQIHVFFLDWPKHDSQDLWLIVNARAMASMSEWRVVILTFIFLYSLTKETSRVDRDCYLFSLCVEQRGLFCILSYVDPTVTLSASWHVLGGKLRTETLGGSGLWQNADPALRQDRLFQVLFSSHPTVCSSRCSFRGSPFLEWKGSLGAEA